ncbi:sugar ABC transporter ATP-binding protein [Leucobacter ruminantium]|uniref:Sugar ABC transporter ATP-binding protein n=1 Tax=Leucobacter ruminantium TaxID=1289170 RepID=A0A939RUY1_9MICO|nr:sugar ABC transporter ATP-binding protein [Leucobacter ruminantium]MBO1806300.1 sugar ABC transporter ATP-binding protein [Leucobacter ruminantium]
MVHALSVTGLKKSFGGVPVLRDMSFDVAPGSVTVLAGENGAGKSTLFKIISGQLAPDDGTVEIEGSRLDSVNPHAARALGVGIVPQELAPYEDLSVAENLFVGHEPKRFGFVLKRREMVARARSMLEEFGVSIDPSRPMSSLSVAYTQIIEIVKATTSGARVLLLDEPTSSIPAAEVARLYAVIDRLRAQGVAMIYTTHRMAEIEAIADRVVVLRDGALVLDEEAGSVAPEQIVTAMIGRDLGQLFPQIEPPGETTAISVSGLRRREGVPTIDLEVRRGEILGIGGLVGAGRSATLAALFGARRAVEGTVAVGDRRLDRPRVRDSIAAGVAFVPEDRKAAGLILSRSVLDNLTLPYLQDHAVLGVLKQPSRRRTAKELGERVRLRSRSLGQLVETLSGGNQQKIVISRWLGRTPSVLLLDEPTRGVDVGARGEIYRIISDLAASGMAVILVSSDMPELIGMSHRVCVMRRGEITGELTREELDSPEAQNRIFHLASGEEAALTAAVPTIPSTKRATR